MMKNKKNTAAHAGLVLSAAALFGSAAALADTLEWDNSAADNDFSNSNNWSLASTGTYDFRNVSLASPDHPVVSAGQSNVVGDVRVGINGDAQLDITGGFLRSGRSGGDDRIGYGNTAVINQSGGVYEIAHDLAIGLGSGSDATFNLSGGLLSQQGGKLTIAEGGTGVLNISGGALETRYYVDIYGTGTFAVQGSGASSIGIGSQGSGTAYWNQRNGGTLDIMIDSGGVTPIVIDDYDDGGDADVTFAFGSLLDVSFADGFLESNTWTVMTWEGDVTDNGLQFATNVDYEVWSFAITNNSLQVTYGEAGEAPATNLPPTEARTLYWSSDAADTDMTVATNWVVNSGGAYEAATWGLYENDTVYIGHNGANAVEGPVYEATYAGKTAEAQGALTIGYARTGQLNFNSGSLDFESSQIKLGDYVRGHGILNMNGGTLEGESFRVGMYASGNTGYVNLSGGTLYGARGFTLEGNSTSLSLGESGAYGEMNITGGSLDIRFGATLGSTSGGTAKFHVEGSAAALIGIGTKNSGSDGNWIQNSGSTLSVAIDEGGLTPITVKGWGDGGAFATFETNSILDVAWSAGVTNWGVFDVLTWDGVLTDNGLTFSTNVNTDIWSFAFVDTDGDSTNDTLQVTADPGSTEKGTSILWLYSHGLDETDEFVDNDADGLLTWEEYIAGTDPTDEASVLKLNSLSSFGTDYIISWQSVSNKSYSIITNTSLSVENKGTAVSGIIATDSETSVTSSIPSASALFIEIGVE